MPLGEKDRRHFAVIAQSMAAEKSAQRAETLESTVAERMAMGMLLGAGPRDPTVERSLDERARGQIGIARRRPRPAA